MTHYTFSGSQTFTSRAYDLLPGDDLDVADGATMIGQINQNYDASALIRAVGARIVNRGTITNYYAPIDLSAGSTLVNSGTVQSSTLGAQAVRVLADVANSTNFIYNSGRIVTLNSSSYAISGGGNVSVVNAVGNVILENYGRINGAGGGSPSMGPGTSVGASDGYVLNMGAMARVSVGAGTLVNQGTVATTTAHVVNNNGLMQSGGAFELTSVYGTAADDSVVNTGKISGDLRLRDGADVVDNRHGTIDGGIDLGAGDDRFDSSGGILLHSSQSPYDIPAILGGLGDDIILAGDNSDLIYGDNISGDTSGGADTLYGRGGDDVIYGGFGADTLLGNLGNDTLMGNQGADYIQGGQGNDTIYGGQDDDVVNGGIGDDLLYGNRGSDTFVFSSGFGHDVIADFGSPDGAFDRIRFEAGTFASYADVQAHMAQVGADVVITLDALDAITVRNVTVVALTADHFLFG